MLNDTLQQMFDQTYHCVSPPQAVDHTLPGCPFIDQDCSPERKAALKLHNRTQLIREMTSTYCPLRPQRAYAQKGAQVQDLGSGRKNPTRVRHLNAMGLMQQCLTTPHKLVQIGRN